MAGMSNVEGAGAARISKSSPTGNFANLLKTALSVKLAGGGGEGSKSAAPRGKTKWDYYNEDLIRSRDAARAEAAAAAEHARSETSATSAARRAERAKRSEFGREESRRKGSLADVSAHTAEGRAIKSLAADGKGGFSVAFENLPPRETPSGQSGIVRGKQFTSRGTPGKPGTYKDTRAAVAGGHITAEEAIGISPTYAQKYAEKAAAKAITTAAAKSEKPATTSSAKVSRAKTPKSPKA